MSMNRETEQWLKSLRQSTSSPKTRHYNLNLIDRAERLGYSRVAGSLPELSSNCPEDNFHYEMAQDNYHRRKKVRMQQVLAALSKQKQYQQALLNRRRQRARSVECFLRQPLRRMENTKAALVDQECDSHRHSFDDVSSLDSTCWEENVIDRSEVEEISNSRQKTVTFRDEPEYFNTSLTCPYSALKIQPTENAIGKSNSSRSESIVRPSAVTFHPIDNNGPHYQHQQNSTLKTDANRKCMNGNLSSSHGKNNTRQHDAKLADCDEPYPQKQMESLSLERLVEKKFTVSDKDASSNIATKGIDESLVMVGRQLVPQSKERIDRKCPNVLRKERCICRSLNEHTGRLDGTNERLPKSKSEFQLKCSSKKQAKQSECKEFPSLPKNMFQQPHPISVTANPDIDSTARNRTRHQAANSKRIEREKQLSAKATAFFIDMSDNNDANMIPLGFERSQYRGNKTLLLRAMKSRASKRFSTFEDRENPPSSSDELIDYSVLQLAHKANNYRSQCSPPFTNRCSPIVSSDNCPRCTNEDSKVEKSSIITPILKSPDKSMKDHFFPQLYDLKGSTLKDVDISGNPSSQLARRAELSSSSHENRMVRCKKYGDIALPTPLQMDNTLKPSKELSKSLQNGECRGQKTEQEQTFHRARDTHYNSCRPVSPGSDRSSHDEHTQFIQTESWRKDRSMPDLRIYLSINNNWKQS